MLLASTPATRPPLRAVHMGEPNITNSARIFPLSDDVCLSNNSPDEDIEAVSRPLDTIGTNNAMFSSSASSLVVDAEPLTYGTPNQAPAISSFNNNNNGDGRSSETCSSEAPQKGLATVNTSSTAAEATAKNTETDSAGSEVAVREDAEGIEKEEDNQGLCERQSPSPSPSLTNTTSSNNTSTMRRQPLTSSLKAQSSLSAAATRKGRNKRTKRRIRGIWGDDKSSQFSQLHDETILQIMKFFSMKDLCVASMVCQRFKHLALHQDSWKRIDATDFVEAAHGYYLKIEDESEAPKSTSLALAARIERYTPISLSIHSIGQRLSPDNFLSSMPSLLELKLTSFSGLTDTHVHVLLLSSSCKNVQARSKRASRMLKLSLENCPLLTNATVQSIGNLCPQLEELSLKGNSKITDLSPLNELWMHSSKPVPPFAAASTNAATSSAAASSMFSMFGPPAPAPPSKTSTSMASLFQPPPPAPRPTSPPATNPLQSLFAPPGQSPPRTSKEVISILPRPLSKKNSSVKQPAKLARVNVSNTGVTAKSLLAAWKTAVPSMKVVRLAHLVMNGNGETWNDASLREMANLLDLAKLETLEIGCCTPSSRTISDEGIQRLIEADGGTSQEKAPFSSLKRLNLAGHQALSGTCIANIISRAESALEELVLDCCTGLSARSSNAAKDFTHVDALSKAIMKCTTREKNNNGDSNGGRGLRRLSLSGCFSNQALLQKNNSKQMHEETIGSFLLESLGPSQKKKAKGNKKNDNPPSSTNTTINTSTTVSTLIELDLTGCWFVTSSDVASLRKRCPTLSTIHLEGTRALPKA